jgi:hypothetical protein
MMLLAFQVTMPTEGTNPYAWFLVIALGAIGFMFFRSENNYAQRLSDKDKLVDRCEKQQDLLLTDNRAQADTIKEQSATLLRISSLAENTVEGIKVTHQKVDSVIRLLEERSTTTRRQS